MGRWVGCYARHPTQIGGKGWRDLKVERVGEAPTGWRNSSNSHGPVTPGPIRPGNKLHHLRLAKPEFCDRWFRSTVDRPAGAENRGLRG